MTVADVECLHPERSAVYSYRKGCRCGRCVEGRRARDRAYHHHRCLSCDRWARSKVGVNVCRRCRDLAELHANEPDEATREWAANVWAAWTPQQRAEVAGALESLLASVRGEGHGGFARGRSSMSAGEALAGPKRTLAERIEEKPGVGNPWQAGLKYLDGPSSGRAA